MKWSFRITRVAGIDVKIHITFFLILLFALPFGQTFGLPGILFGILLILLLFVCVTLHELGHSVVAQLLGIPVREIILLPLGGVAFLERNPTKPIHELLIALAGPLVNVAIALVLLLVTGTTAYLGLLNAQGAVQGLGMMQPSPGTLLIWLIQANVALVVFNMIPAFPLDGGRVFRSIIAMFTGYPRATRIASAVGQALAIVLGFFGVISGNFLLILVAIFVFFGAGQENVEGHARTVLTTLRVGDAYNKYALQLNIGDRVSKVVDYILTSYQPDFAVVQGGNLIGIVTREDVLRALANSTQDVYVTSIMRRDVVRVDANASLDEVRQTMLERNVRVVAVYDSMAYLGLVSLEDIAEAFSVVSFLQRQQEAHNESSREDSALP